MEKGNLPKAQEHNEKAREMLQQTMAKMQAMQNVIEQVKEQNQDLQKFQEQGQQPSAENEEFNELQAQQQELAQEIQATNQPQAQAEAEKAQMEMEAGNMSKAQEHNEKAGELLQQAMAAAMGQEEMTAEKKDMPAPGAGEEKTEEKTELAGGGPGEETKEEVDLPNFQTNELDIGEVSTGDGWTRELGESEKTSIRQGAQTEGPKAYKSLADQYFEAIGAN
jgi:chromosome segregation ATPase